MYPGGTNPKKVNVPLLACIVVIAAFEMQMFPFSLEFQDSMKHIAMDRYGVEEYAWGFLNTVPYMLGVFLPNLIGTLIKMIKAGTLSKFSLLAGDACMQAIRTLPSSDCLVALPSFQSSFDYSSTMGQT